MGKQDVLSLGNTGKTEAMITAGTVDETSTKEYIDQTVAELENLAALVDVAKERVTCDVLFHRVIRRTVDTTDHYPEALAKELAVSNSTISRWMNEHSAPHPAKKPQIYKQIKKICSKEARALKKTIAA